MDTRTISLSDGASLHAIDAGSGQPLIMIPGWSQSAAEYGLKSRSWRRPAAWSHSICGAMARAARRPAATASSASPWICER